MKKMLYILVCALLTINPVIAYDFIQDGIYYEFCSSGVAVTNASSVGNSYTMTSLEVPDEVIYNGSTYSVVAISKDAFKNCTALRNVVIPDGVHSIAAASFSGCSNLQSVSLPFVGGEISTTASESTLFGFVFGETEFGNATAVTQNYTSSTNTAHTYYIPATLSKITIRGGNILYGSLYLGTLPVDTIVIEGASSIASYSIESQSVRYLRVLNPSNATTAIEAKSLGACAGLEEMEISFVGVSPYKYVGDYLFGKIFPSTKYDGGVSTRQETQNGQNRESFYFYLPATLKKVIVHNGLPDFAFYGCKEIETIVVYGGKSRSIGRYAFGSCYGLKHIDIKGKIEEINSYAFASCYVPRVSIASGLKRLYANAFSQCYMDSIVLPSSLKTIGDNAFMSCYKLRYLMIPDSVTQIGTEVLKGCSNLKVLSIPYIGSTSNLSRASANTLLGYFFGTNSFSSASRVQQKFGNGSSDIVYYYVPDSLEKVIVRNENVLYGAFMGCKKLKSIEITHGDVINPYTFDGCTSLCDLAIPNTITYIGDYAFYDCSSLTNLSFSNSLTKIGSSAFAGCQSLKYIEVPKSVQQIGSSAFYRAGLDSIELPFAGYRRPTSTRDANAGQFKNVFSTSSTTLKKVFITDQQVINFTTFSDCSSIEEIIVTGNVTQVGHHAFSNCTSLKKLVLPNQVDSIEGNALAYCMHLQSMRLPDSLPRISEFLFYGCTNLESIVIPKHLKEVSQSAFGNCNSLSLVQYCGTKMQWQNIVIESGNEPLLNATLQDHYGIIYTGDRFFFNGIHYQVVSATEKTVEIVAGDQLYSGDIYIPKEARFYDDTLRLVGIGENAFSNCTDLTSISFSGSNIQWRKLYVEYGNEMLTTIPIYFNATQETGVNPVYLDPVTMKPGAVSELSVGLHNESPVTGFQFELELPQGFSVHETTPGIYAASVSSMRTSATNHDICSVTHLANDRYRVICSSTTNATFSGAEGEVMRIAIEAAESVQDGTYTLRLFNIAVSDASASVSRTAKDSCQLTLISSYQITFLNEDGTILQTGEVNNGQMPIYNGATPTKPATAQYTYTFIGWTPEVEMATSDATYTATYSNTINSYMITFVNYDGSILQSGSINYGVTPTYNGATPTKPATAQYTYIFEGWDKEIASVVGAETYTAQYDSIVNKYTITFLDEDGTTILQTSKVEYGQIPTYNGETPIKAGTAQYTYTFRGWSPEVVAVMGVAIYTATYSSTINSYLITFANHDGSTLQSGEVNYGVTPAYIGATPTKPTTAQYTYTFVGWDKEIVSVVGAETYTAQFDSVVNEYTIIFVYEEGIQISDVKYGQIPAYIGPTPTKAATAEYTYTFAGWTPEVVAVTGAATYTATFTATKNKYIITFLDEDGTTILQTSEVEYGQIPAYNGATPSKPATAQYTYTFDGWDKEIVSVVGAETYTAQFDSIVNQYTITARGENCTFIGDGVYDYGTEVTLMVIPDKGYRFVEWSDGVADVTRLITVTEDAIFTAIVEEAVGTGWQGNNQSEQVLKIFDGTNYYIIRGGKRYTMQGLEVK